MKTITIKLPNGLEITGEPDVVMAALEKQGYTMESVVPDGYYMSASKGLIKISQMNSRHIINAVMVMYRRWLDGSEKLSVGEFRKKILQGPDADQLRSLMQELIRRPPEE